MKKTIIWILILSFVLALSGCNNQEQPTSSVEESLLGTAKPPIVDREVTPLSYSNIPQENGLLQGSESITYVGLGYNILENTYMDPLSFTLGNYILKEEEVQKRLKTGIPNKKSAETIIGTTVSSYSKELSTKLELTAEYPLFSGKITSEYNSSLTNKANTYFIKSMSGYIKHSEFLPNTNDLKDILDDVFKKDLNGNMSPKSLFQKYGTHLLREALMGARCTQNYTYLGSETDTVSSVKGKVTAAYSYIEGTATGQTATEASEFISKSHFQSILIGGKDIDASSLASLQKNFPDWVSSLKEYPPSIYGVSNINSLIPIWELTDDTKRADELKKYFDDRGGDIKKSLENWSKIPESPSTKEYIQSVIISSDKDSEQARKKNDYENLGYKFIGKDLNKGSGGDYIYIWYKTTTDADEALRDIRFTYGDFVDIPSFYTKNGIDLNQGAGGRHIYMWTTKRASLGEPITAIDIFYGKNANMAVGYEAASANYYADGKNTRERAELNEGAGGDYIYLGYTTK